ncbi:MAG: PEP-CTERM sorting domain-containing protein [Rubripirellula sp.]
MERKLIGAVALAAFLVVPTQAKAGILTSDPINSQLFAPNGYRVLYAAGSLSGSLDSISVDLAAKTDNNNGRPNDFSVAFINSGSLAVTHYFSGLSAGTTNSTALYRGLESQPLNTFTLSGVQNFQWGGSGETAGGAGTTSLVRTVSFTAFDPSNTIIAYAMGWAGANAATDIDSNNANGYFGSSAYVPGYTGATRAGTITLSGSTLAEAGSGGAVPEPSTCLTFVLAGVGGIARRRRRR